MTYREDADLNFLKDVLSEDLTSLLEIVRGKDGDFRRGETITSSPEYQQYFPDHSQYWSVIAGDLQLYGGNSFANLFRWGTGVTYREILIDVCNKMKVNYNKKSTTDIIETNLLLKILEDSLEKMSEEDRRKFVEEVGVNTTDFTKQAVLSAVLIGMKAGGFMTFQVTVIIANAVTKAVLGHGLTLAGNAALTRAAGLIIGPIGWAVTALWTAWDIAGPAYRVTIPACVYIAFLRQKQLTSTC